MSGPEQLAGEQRGGGEGAAGERAAMLQGLRNVTISGK